MSLDDLQAQLRGALDQQFAALKQHYETAIGEARQQATADAERDASTRLDTARAEWDAKLNAMLETTRAETRQQAEHAAKAEHETLERQLQQQLEQSVQHAVASVRQTTQQEIEALRRRVDEDVQAERQRGEAAQQAAVAAERQRTESAIETAIAAERQRNEPAIQSAIEAERVRAQQAFESERQDAQQKLDAVRTSAQQALEAERTTAQQALEAERARAKTELETVQQLLEADVASAQTQATTARSEADAAIARANEAVQAAAAAAAAAPVPAAASAPVAVVSEPSIGVALGRLVDAVRVLDTATSQTQSIETLVQYTAGIAGRAVVFLVNRDVLRAWRMAGIAAEDVPTTDMPIDGPDLLARAIQTGQTTPASAELPAPPFAKQPPDRPAVAVPLMVSGRAVAVVYADPGAANPTPGWIDAVETLTRYAAATTALRAALRTLDVLRGDAPEPAPDAPVNGNGEEGARRYARLLVSEIKLYNEAAVRAGRQQRDLRQRLRAEIDRAQRLYEERVPPAVSARAQYFHQELVQTLADGDPTLLGN